MNKIQLLSLATTILVLSSCKEEKKAHNPLDEADVIPVKISSATALTYTHCLCKD